MSKVKFATCQGIYEYDATDMTKVEYEKIKWNRDTPEYVKINDDEAYFNEFTCLGGYAGTCNCMSHPRKKWIRFNPTTGSHS